MKKRISKFEFRNSGRAAASTLPLRRWGANSHHERYLEAKRRNHCWTSFTHAIRTLPSLGLRGRKYLRGSLGGLSLLQISARSQITRRDEEYLQLPRRRINTVYAGSSRLPSSRRATHRVDVVVFQRAHSIVGARISIDTRSFWDILWCRRTCCDCACLLGRLMIRARPNKSLDASSGQ